MAPTYRAGAAFLWSNIREHFDGDTVNRQSLWKEGLHRLQDSVLAIRDMVHSLRAQLSSQEGGSPAVLRGSVDMSTLAFYDPIDVPLGSLDGKTLIVSSELDTVTITFAQPTSPAAAAAEANSQGSSTGITFTVDDGVDPITGAYVPSNVGKFRLVRPGGGTATITFGNGTANGILGFTNGQSATGTGTANDGASKIGLGAFTLPTGWTGGSLRDFLQLLFTLADATSTGKVDKAGDTMTGHLTMNATSEIKLADRTVTRPLRTPWSFSYDATPEWLLLNTGNPAQQLTVDTNGQVALREIDALTGDVITGATVWLKFDGSHGSYPPAQFPRVRLFWVDNTGVPTYEASEDDTPADQAEYEDLHSIEITGLNLTVDADKQYRIEVLGENEQTGLQVYDVTVTVTTKGLPPGG